MTRPAQRRHKTCESAIVVGAVLIRFAAAALVALAAISPARAHAGQSSFVAWGNFGAAAPCQRVIAAAAERCAVAALEARAACHETSLAGVPCDVDATAARIAAARSSAIEAIDGGCDDVQAAALGYEDRAAALAGAVRACRAVEALGDTPYTSLTSGADDASRSACVQATAAAARDMVRYGVRSWRHTLDRIAVDDLPVATRDQLAARTAEGIERLQRIFAASTVRRCGADGFRAVYGQSPDQLFAAMAQAGACFAGAAYAQSVVTCSQAPAAAAALADTPTATPTPPGTATRTPTRAATPNLSISAPSSGQVVGVEGVSFTWTQAANATGYDLRIVDPVTQAVLFSGSLSGAASTSTIISVPKNGNYSFRVRACTGGTFTDATCGGFASRSFSVDLVAPSAAPTVTAPAPGAQFTTSRQTLSWTTVAGNPALPDLFYEVQLVNLGSGQTELTLRTFHPTASTPAVLRSGNYRLRVRACQAACGPYSGPVDFSVALGAVPSSAPTVQSASVSGGNSLNTSWTAVGGAEWYQVQVVQPPPAGPGGGALTVAARQIIGATSASNIPVPIGNAFVIVAACNGDGCGPYSGGSAISPAGPNPSAPQIGVPIPDSVVDGPSVLFAWSRVPGDTGNTVYRLYVQDLSRQTAALDVLTTDNFYGALLKAEGAKYAAVVFANPGLPNEVQGPGAAFTVRGNSAVAPTLIAPTHQSSVTPGNVLFAWSPVPGATLYEYYVAVQGVSAATGRGVTPGLFVQVPLAAMNGQATVYSAIARACPAGNTCVGGSDDGWGPWSDVAGTGSLSVTVLAPTVPVGGASLRFNGNGSGDIDRVKIALDAPARPLDIGGDLTIEFWMKTAAGNASGACSAGGTGWTSGNVLVDREVFGGGDNGDYGIALFGSGGRLAFGVARGATAQTICGSANVATGTWHHVAVTRRTSDGAMRLFVDGQLDASGTGPSGDISYRDGRATSHATTDPFLVLGAEKFDSGAAYHGWLDELRVSNGIRYGAAFTPPSAPFAADGATAALYHFDEDNGNNVLDASGASGGPSDGTRRLGGAPAGPLWSTDTPFTSATPAIALTTIASGLNSPTSVVQAGDQRLFITEQSGTIRIWDGTQLRATPFLTVSGLASGGERGLLSVAFHPQYASNGRFYVYYTNSSGDPEIARYTVSGDPNVADPSSKRILLTVDHPDDQANHNGGQLVFGPDGYLYAGFGDGGAGCDVAGAGCNAQNTSRLLGKIVRLDVDQNVNTPPYYGIPPDNPFVGGGPPLDEIWAIGVRNPWRFSFDRLTDSLFIGDVGQDTREEVDVQTSDSPGGQNYGWKRMEGFACNTCDVSDCTVAPPPCNDPSLTLPVLDYTHAAGNCAVTGGFVYRGTRLPYLYGKYVFGDLCSGRIWWAADNLGTWSFTQFTPTAGGLQSFGQGLDGELYVARGNGTVSRLDATP